MILNISLRWILVLLDDFSTDNSPSLLLAGTLPLFD
jgi:hypothetical protein